MGPATRSRFPTALEMNGGWVAAVAALLLASCARPPTPTGGVVSLNPCADAMLVRLVAPERIAAISHYSLQPGATSIPLDVARRFRATAGTAEEVVAMRPSLVLASTFTPPPTRAAFARARLRTLYLDSPATVAASRAQVLEVAAALDARARGAAMAGEIDRALAELAPGRPGHPAALLFIAGDLATGSGTLLHELLSRAGFANAAARYGLAHTGTLPAELLAGDPPDVVLAPDAAGRTAAMRARLLPRTPVAAFPRELVNCGGPSIAPALRRLRAVRAALA